MAQDNKINLPGGFGGLMRYSDEYSSYVNLKPAHVVLFVILIVAFRIAMPFIFK
ncbi:MAG: preprotein translocase subunit Sec61beta [Candidatus Pacearchaeota archaeon]|nr:preprotein translocase subunit Sec61beta [Candidatus Pacearchaeota archaeon]